MGIDEARHRETPAAVDLGMAVILRVRAHDPIADDGDVGRRHEPGDDVEQAQVLQNEVGGSLPWPARIIFPRSVSGILR